MSHKANFSKDTIESALFGKNINIVDCEGNVASADYTQNGVSQSSYTMISDDLGVPSGALGFWFVFKLQDDKATTNVAFSIDGSTPIWYARTQVANQYQYLQFFVPSDTLYYRNYETVTTQEWTLIAYVEEV